jgi:hypothetical protein
VETDLKGREKDRGTDLRKPRTDLEKNKSKINC